MGVMKASHCDHWYQQTDFFAYVLLVSLFYGIDFILDANGESSDDWRNKTWTKHFNKWLATCLLRSDSIRWSEKVYLDCNQVRHKWIEIRMILEAKNEQSVWRYDAKCFREIDMKSCRQCGSISFDCTSTKIW